MSREPLIPEYTYKDSAGYTTPDGGAWGYKMMGAALGSSKTASSGAYAGITSFINLGQTTLTSSSSSVFTASPGSWQRVTRGGSTAGAPNGPYPLCIGSVLMDGSCSTAPREFRPNAYKFNIYAFGWEQPTAPGAWANKAASWPGGTTAYAGVRVKYVAACVHTYPALASSESQTTIF